MSQVQVVAKSFSYDWSGQILLCNRTAEISFPETEVQGSQEGEHVRTEEGRRRDAGFSRTRAGNTGCRSNPGREHAVAGSRRPVGSKDRHS